MKVVINKCFGGFGLSAQAEDMYALLKEFVLYRYRQTKYLHRDGVEEYKRCDDDEDISFFSHTCAKDLGEKTTTLPDESYWSSNDIERADPLLIEVVEKLGEKANGEYAKLGIIEIPDGVEYEIKEYDGLEHIAEKHRTWR